MLRKITYYLFYCWPFGLFVTLFFLYLPASQFVLSGELSASGVVGEESLEDQVARDLSYQYGALGEIADNCKQLPRSSTEYLELELSSVTSDKCRWAISSFSKNGSWERGGFCGFSNDLFREGPRQREVSLPPTRFKEEKVDPWGRAYLYRYNRLTKVVSITCQGEKEFDESDDIVGHFPLSRQAQAIQIELCNKGDTRCAFDFNW